ncbi:transposase, partial [Brucella cytisi]|uniref:transposase n=1 Tax=Brucella cytisi TaxID=407152 RepID=UPI00313E172E
MLKKPAPSQTALEMVTLDSLVPKDHLLRKIDAVIDFSFIHDRVAGLYCADNGRPALDPTLMFKALFIGYLFGIRSERQLVREIEVNVAYRWFLRMKLTDGVFDASTLSQNRRLHSGNLGEIRIASLEMFPDCWPLPHLICSQHLWVRSKSDEADQRDDEEGIG